MKEMSRVHEAVHTSCKPSDEHKTAEDDQNNIQSYPVLKTGFFSTQLTLKPFVNCQYSIHTHVV